MEPELQRIAEYHPSDSIVLTSIDDRRDVFVSGLVTSEIGTSERCIGAMIGLKNGPVGT